MKKKSFGIILIFISFILIISGFLYKTISNSKVVIPNKNNIINNSDKYITVTSTEEKSYYVSKDGKVVDKNGKEIKNTYKKENTNLDNDNNEIIDDDNNNLRNSIENKFGIEILYGNETIDYSIAGLTTTPIIDNNVITNELNTLNSLMELYPNNFFNELNKSIPLTIILVDKYSSAGVCGLTDSSYSEAIMSIASGNEFIDTFHHEIYHYMERYIYKKDGSFANWVNYNPVGFEYGNVNDDFPVYNRTFSSTAYFVNSYSKTDQFEDRASIFEYLMSSTKASCFNKNMPLYYKALVMSDLIDRYISSCSTTRTEYWERFLVE